jgi:hypothetical protein
MTDGINIPEVFASDLCEIIEALETPVMTNNADQLIEVVERTKFSPCGTPVLDLLDEAKRIFVSRSGHAPSYFFFSKNKSAELLADKLRAFLPCWPYYVYHGTTSKALPSILEMGLVPHGGKSCWEGIVNEEYLSSGVFLTASWRSAVHWAQSTALTKAYQLRKDGSLPAIIRIRANGMVFEKDLRSRTPHSLLYVGELDVGGASCFTITEGGGEAPRDLPTWLSIEEVVDKLPASLTQVGVRRACAQMAAI